MKRSNLLLLILSVIFLAGLLITDQLLVIQYKKTNLHDPYKNFQSLSVLPFRALKISGGNGYAISIQRSDSFHIKLRESRKSFFKMRMVKDTLLVTFTVANQNYQKPQDASVGLIIFVPGVRYLEFSGTNNEVVALRQDSLRIHQGINTVTRLKELETDYLDLSGTATSYFDFTSKNKTGSLNVDLQNSAVINFSQLNFQHITPTLKDSAAIVVYSKSLKDLRSKQ